MKRFAPILAVAVTVCLSGVAVEAGAAPSPSPGAVSSTPLERVNAYVEPSIVYAQIVWSGVVYDKFNKTYLNKGKPFTISSQCTGFVVNPNGYIATAGHCVEYRPDMAEAFIEQGAQWAVANRYYVKTTLTVDQIVAFKDFVVLGPDKTGPPTRAVTAAWGASVSGFDAVQQKPARILSFQKFEEGDAALLKVEASDLNAIQLATASSVVVGQDIVAIGYPASVGKVTDASLNPSFKPGQVSSVKTTSRGLLTVYELSAAVSGGMSGGPTVDLSGRVVGINSFKITGESQAFNFVNPSGRIAELMAAAGVKNEPGPTSVNYRKGLDAFFAGDKVTAVTALTAVTKDQPANGLAATYLKKASALPDPVAATTTSNTGPIIGGAAALLLAGAAGVLLWLRHRRQTAGEVPAGPALPSNGAQSGPPIATPPIVPPEWASASTPTRHMASQTPQHASGQMPNGSDGQMSAPTTAASAPASGSCLACGQPFAAGQRFCGNCGQPASTQSP